MAKIPRCLLVDSGFFFALLDPRDPYHGKATAKQEWLELLTIILPWPILYETVNTRFARRPAMIARFETIVRGPDTTLLDDGPYRLGAYEDTIARGKAGRNPMSLVDAVVRAVLADVNNRIDAVLTFNERDFADICRARQIEIL